MIGRDKTVLGGQSSLETLQIAPTILDNVVESDPVMQEEIFGPILPILTYDRFDELYERLADKPKPLALYLFVHNAGAFAPQLQRRRSQAFRRMAQYLAAHSLTAGKEDKIKLLSGQERL